VALDSSGNLYVADTGNNRALYFPAGQTTATSVYGQDASFTNATANNGGLSASSLSAPVGVALDLNDNLYIADTGNNRTLYYPSGQTTATHVYGQGGDFTANTANNNGIGSTSLSAPAGVTLDASGNIYSADAANNRVLQYQDKLHVTSQPAATISVDASFSVAFSLTDVGSGLAFADFAGSVSLLIKSGSGARGAALGGTTTVTGTSGVATFSNLSIDTAGTGYVLTGKSSGVGQVDTNSFDAVGTLSETIASISSPSTTLNGTDQAMIWQIVLNVADTRGTGAGWNLTITSTQLKTLTGKTLPTTATRITAVDAACAPASSCTSASNAISYPRTVPADNTAPTPVKFFNAASGSGQGHFQFTITLATTVPANSYKGSYTSTITPAINDGA
jgi:WxL domain surface cell wall-binding